MKTKQVTNSTNFAEHFQQQTVGVFGELTSASSFGSTIRPFFGGVEQVFGQPVAT